MLSWQGRPSDDAAVRSKFRNTTATSHLCQGLYIISRERCAQVRSARYHSPFFCRPRSEALSLALLSHIIRQLQQELTARKSGVKASISQKAMLRRRGLAPAWRQRDDDHKRPIPRQRTPHLVFLIRAHEGRSVWCSSRYSVLSIWGVRLPYMLGCSTFSNSRMTCGAATTGSSSCK